MSRTRPAKTTIVAFASVSVLGAALALAYPTHNDQIEFTGVISVWDGTNTKEAPGVEVLVCRSGKIIDRTKSEKNGHYKSGKIAKGPPVALIFNLGGYGQGKLVCSAGEGSATLSPVVLLSNAETERWENLARISRDVNANEF